MTNPIFQISADARLLISHMKDAPVGQQFTYEELSKVVSREVSGAFPPLHTALKRLLRDHDLVFGTIRGVGLKRLDDKGIVDEAPSYADRIRRRAKRSFERMNKANFSALPQDYQVRFSAHASIMATVAHMTNGTQVAKLERDMPSGKRELPVAETLRMFAK